MPLLSKDLNKFKGIFSIFLFFSLTINYPLSSKNIKNLSIEKDSKQLFKKDFENIKNNLDFKFIDTIYSYSLNVSEFLIAQIITNSSSNQNKKNRYFKFLFPY